jgi:hypothetical protein
VPLSVTFFLNLFVVAPPVPSWMDRWVYGGFGVGVAYVNIALFAVFTVVMAYGVLDSLRHRLAPSVVRAPVASRGADAAAARPSTTTRL